MGFEDTAVKAAPAQSAPAQSALPEDGVVSEIKAPVEGKAYPLNEVPDDVFASGALGGGIGIPPMRGCAQATEGRSTAILGGRSKDKIILQSCFNDECAKVLVATDDGSLGHHGFVDALVRQELEQDKNYDGVLACGPKPMLRNVANVAQEFGIPCQVSMEERMGCGVGACLVCACDMADGSRKHVCKDGPVFRMDELDELPDEY